MYTLRRLDAGFRDNGLVQRRQLGGPLGDFLVGVLGPVVCELEQALHLVDHPLHPLVQNQRHQQPLHVLLRNIQLLRNEWEPDSGVWLDEFEEDLGPDVFQEVLDVVADERVVHDGLAVVPQHFLELADAVLLVRRDQIRHGQHLWVVLVGLGLLRIKRVHLRLHQHIRKHQILEALDSSADGGLVVSLEGLEEVGGGALKGALAHVHLPPALPDHPEDPRVRNRTLDRQRQVVQLLQLLIVLLLSVHLNFDGVDFEELGALLHVVRAVVPLAAPVELLERARQLQKVLGLKVEAAQLEVGLEPQPLVLRVLERLQRHIVEPLQQRQLPAPLAGLALRARPRGGSGGGGIGGGSGDKVQE
mmetsp:Transcript_11885/g.30096  ORF Transcript_11885/g.30096 Transcript_11885/m.30096 type:complete len:360 (-) Transcript_11885:417-1496(-)